MYKVATDHSKREMHRRQECNNVSISSRTYKLLTYITLAKASKSLRSDKLRFTAPGN